MEYIILLRGINVGGRTLKMAELKACFEQAGYRNVRTVLQTGNVIAESRGRDGEKLRRQVETLLSDTFGFAAKVRVMTPEDLRAVVNAFPFSEGGPGAHRYAVFTEIGFEKELIRQAGQLEDRLEAVSPGKGVVYWRVQKGSTLTSDFGKYMDKAARTHFLTNRNLNTLDKILAKCTGQPAPDAGGIK